MKDLTLRVLHKAGMAPAVASECILCGLAPATVVLLPCAHQCVCEADAARYGDAARKRCPMCKVVVTETVTIRLHSDPFGHSLRVMSPGLGE